jgi:hypothetical protein
VLGLKLCEVSGLFNTSEGMASGHPDRPARSTVSRHVGFSDMLLWVPLENFEVASSGRWLASGRLFRPAAARTTGSFLQGLVCIFLFFPRVSL